MDELRSWWEVPSIAHFCSLFRSAFDLTDFDIEDLEEAFLESQREEGSEFIQDVTCRLLNGCYGRKDIGAANYDLYVKDIIKYKWEMTDNPIREKTEFNQLSLREKVDLIHAICEYRLDAEDVPELLKGFEGDNMRVEPLGKDKDGGTYWYFYGNRLYKEDPPPKNELTKEQRRAKERQKRQESRRKKLEEKKEKKKEKEKKKSLKKMEKKKKLEEKVKKQAEKPSNIRRSGRIKLKQELEDIDSGSSESSLSDSSDEQTEESSTEEEEEIEEGEEEEEKKPAEKKKNNRRAPAKRESVAKKETPSKAGSKSFARKSAARKPGSSSATSTPRQQRKQEVCTPQSESGTRRSGRLRNRTAPPPPPPQDSSDDEDIDDIDSGHESAVSDDDAKSVRSEVSKLSTQSNGLQKNSSHAPRAKIDITRESVSADDVENEEEKMDSAEQTNVDDKKDETVKEGETDEGDNTGRLEEQMEIDKEESCNGGETSEEKEGDNKAYKNETEEGESTYDTVDIKTDMDTKEGSCETIEEEEECDINKGELCDKKNEVDESEKSCDTKMEVVKKEESYNTEVKENKKKENCTIETMPEQKDTIEEKMDIKTEVNNETEGNSGTSKTEKVENEEKPNTDQIENDSKNIKPELIKPLKLASCPEPSKSETRWHLICSTLDDWVNLAEWFKESTIRCEKTLSKVITEDFLPVLPEIIEARDAEKRKRLQELEVRRSQRITYKQREKLEQEKILAEALAEEESARIQAEEERKLKDEQLRLEEEIKQREERVKAREERANRLSMREEKARLLAEGKEIPAELIYTGHSKYKDDSDSDDSRCDLKDDESYDTLMKVINAMKLHKDCWPFLEPVTDEQAPGYSDVIKRPMDISKIEKKVVEREYRATQHFLSDFRLMFNNCKRYNGQDSEFSECARVMETMLKKYKKRFLSDEPMDSYYQDKDFALSVRGGTRAIGERKFRPRRAASSRAMETVQKALGSDDEEDSSDEDQLEPLYVRKKVKVSPIKTPSHHSLLLQEMIELKRQREKKLAASALANHDIITRGPERVRIPNPTGGVMIIPKDELPPTGVLRLAATREIKRKINPQFANMQGLTLGGKKDIGLHVTDTSKPGSRQPKTIRIVAASPNSSGQASVKETAESVKVSADGYLIIGGKNSGIKVSENTKIVIQPPGSTPPQGSPSSSAANVQTSTPLGKEILIKKIPTPTGLKPLINSNLAGPNGDQDTKVTSSQQTAAPIIKPIISTRVPAIINATHAPLFQKQQQSPQQVTQQTSTFGTAVNNKGLSMKATTTSNETTLTPENEMRKKQVDIAQRIILLNQKRKLLQQQQMLQQIPQNGSPTEQATPPKIRRLDPGAGNQSASQLPVHKSPGYKSIEDRLREPNIESELGVVSENVVSNVNIAGDILDTYYSVLNSSKASTSDQSGALAMKNSPSAAAIQQRQDVATNIRNILLKTNKLVTVVSQEQQEVKTNVITNGPSVQQHQVLSDTTDTGNSSVSVHISDPNTPICASVEYLTNKIQPVSSKPNPHVVVERKHTHLTPTLTNPGALKPKPFPAYSSVSEIFSASPQSEQKIEGSTMTPIEALFTGNHSVKVSLPTNFNTSSTVTMSPKSVNINVTRQPAETVHSNITVPANQIPSLAQTNLNVVSDQTKNINANLLTNQSTNLLPTSVSMSGNQISSPSKNDRTNLFDMFESVNQTAATPSNNDFGFAALLEKSPPGEKEAILEKLKSQGIKIPSSSTVNFGSPLKTSSIMEALKSKLHHPVKSDPEPTMTESQVIVEPVSKTQSVPSHVACNPVASSPSPTHVVVTCDCTSDSTNPACNHCNLTIDTSQYKVQSENVQKAVKQEIDSNDAVNNNNETTVEHETDLSTFKSDVNNDTEGLTDASERQTEEIADAQSPQAEKIGEDTADNDLRVNKDDGRMKCFRGEIKKDVVVDDLDNCETTVSYRDKPDSCEGIDNTCVYTVPIKDIPNSSEDIDNSCVGTGPHKDIPDSSEDIDKSCMGTGPHKDIPHSSEDIDNSFVDTVPCKDISNSSEQNYNSCVGTGPHEDMSDASEDIDNSFVDAVPCKDISNSSEENDNICVGTIPRKDISDANDNIYSSYVNTVSYKGISDSSAYIDNCCVKAVSNKDIPDSSKDINKTYFDTLSLKDIKDSSKDTYDNLEKSYQKFETVANTVNTENGITEKDDENLNYCEKDILKKANQLEKYHIRYTLKEKNYDQNYIESKNIFQTHILKSILPSSYGESNCLFEKDGQMQDNIGKKETLKHEVGQTEHKSETDPFEITSVKQDKTIIVKELEKVGDYSHQNIINRKTCDIPHVGNYYVRKPAQSREVRNDQALISNNSPDFYNCNTQDNSVTKTNKESSEGTELGYIVKSPNPQIVTYPPSSLQFQTGTETSPQFQDRYLSDNSTKVTRPLLKPLSYFPNSRSNLRGQSFSGVNQRAGYTEYIVKAKSKTPENKLSMSALPSIGTLFNTVRQSRSDPYLNYSNNQLTEDYTSRRFTGQEACNDTTCFQDRYKCDRNTERQFIDDTADHFMEDLGKLRLQKKLERLSTVPSKMYQLAGIKPRTHDATTTMQISLLTGRGKRRGTNSGKGSRRAIKALNALKNSKAALSQSEEVIRQYHLPRKVSFRKEKCVGDSLEMAGFISDEEAKQELDRNMTCGEDFFTSELISNLFPSNLDHDGGGSRGDNAVDPDLEKIENDIFELQETYLGSQAAAPFYRPTTKIQISESPCLPASQLTGLTQNQINTSSVTGYNIAAIGQSAVPQSFPSFVGSTIQASNSYYNARTDTVLPNATKPLVEYVQRPVSNENLNTLNTQNMVSSNTSQPDYMQPVMSSTRAIQNVLPSQQNESLNIIESNINTHDSSLEQIVGSAAEAAMNVANINQPGVNEEATSMTSLGASNHLSCVLDIGIQAGYHCSNEFPNDGEQNN